MNRAVKRLEVYEAHSSVIESPQSQQSRYLERHSKRAQTENKKEISFYGLLRIYRRMLG